eukprot:1123432-Pyramimonas_sp.AAC.1
MASGLMLAATSLLRQETVRRRRDYEEAAAAAAPRRVRARLDGQAAPPPAPRMRPHFLLNDEPFFGWPARPVPGRRHQTLVALGRWPVVRRIDGSLIRHVERDDIVMTWYIEEDGTALVTPHPMA